MPPREKNKQKSRPPLLRGQQQLTFARTAATLETKVAQLQQRAARRKRQLQKEEEEEEEDDDDDEEEDAFLKRRSNRGLNRKVQKRRPTRDISWESECKCRGTDEDDDEEDDDDDGVLSGDFLVDDNEEIEYEVDDDLADTNDDERQDVTFWARVNRKMDEKEEEEGGSPDEGENPGDDRTEVDTAAVFATPEASKKTKRAVAAKYIGNGVSPVTKTKLVDVVELKTSKLWIVYEGVDANGRVHARSVKTGNREADRQSAAAAKEKKRNTLDDSQMEKRLKNHMRTLSVSAEEIEEAKKEASRASSQKHREKQAPEERKRASRESEKKCREKKKRNDEEERKRNEEEAAREKAARAQADRQREARLLAKFQYRAEFWLRQSRTGYSDSRFPVVMDDVEKSVVELLVGTASRLLKVDGKSAIEK
jgi:hypothetical protein